MAGAPELVVVAPLRDVERMAGTDDRASVPATAREDFRVRCTSKRAVTELLELCGRIVQKLGEALPEKIREPALRDAQWTFESAVQENVSINGQAWQEASDNCLMASCMENLKCRGETVAKEISEVMKSLPALIEQGDGFSQVLKMQPVIQLQRVHQEVFSGCYRKADVKPESFITQIETTPTETSTRKSTDIVLKRKRSKDCPQRKWYPLRPKRINLDT
uniref:NSL1 component of MIS12 kinetochore complex n=1 Tax=Equus caballus TaxID=9796 RepID=A0A9L0RSG1_HORSE